MEIERDEAAKNVEEVTASTGKTAVFLVISKFLSFIILAISFIIVTRVLGPSKYGTYTLIITIAGLFGVVGNLGISTALNRFISEYRYKNKKKKIESILSNSFAIVIVLGGFLSLAMFFSSGIFAHYVFHNADVLYLVQISAAIILITILYDSALSALIGFNKGPQITLIMFIEGVLQTSVSVLLVVYGFGVIGPILGIIVGQLAGFLVAAYILFIRPKVKIRIEKKTIKKILSFSVPITVSNIIGGIVPQIAPILLSTVIIYFSGFALMHTNAASSSVVLGNYGIVSKVSYFIDVVLGSISLSLLSLFSKLFSGKNSRDIEKFYNYAIFLAFLFIAPLLFLIFALSAPFSYTLFSGYYALAPAYLKIASIGILASIFGMYANVLLISKNKVRKVMRISIAITAIQFVLMPILLFLFEGIGLVLLLFLIQPILSSIFLLNAIKSEFGLRIDFLKISRVFASNIITFALIMPFILFASHYYIMLLVIGALLILFVYPIFLAKTKAIETGDLNIIRGIGNNLPVIKWLLNFYVLYVGSFISSTD
ncbi:MAG: oligosaccharide flippase family protein [Candidatus Marsarchaeota archaeon]|nr:oligosaccharide flippase family protein [Candidatus Marsarchaeota archaeon]MCL5105826.1 oligosaccharide flippase family protein [Candidatus Marsarchaeota archaeon]